MDSDTTQGILESPACRTVRTELFADYARKKATLKNSYTVRSGTHHSLSGVRVSTILVRPGSGRNFAGIESHVRRPITTLLAFWGSAVAIVTSLKYCISCSNSWQKV